MATIAQDVLSVVLPLVVGYATVPAMDAIKHAVGWIDAQPAAVKQGLVVAIASALTIVARYLQVALPADLVLWDASTIDALVAAVFAVAIKQGQQIKAQRHAEAAPHDE
jgi:hypothetical protein